MVAIGADHGAFALKNQLARYLREELGHPVIDLGAYSEEAVDYPDFAAAVAREVAAGRAARGIVIDAAGIGSTMAANKIAGVRCALCHDDATVLNAREHNDANVLALGARVVNRGRGDAAGATVPRRPRSPAAATSAGSQKIMALERSS